MSQYDLVLDCTDHPTSRYLISDICVLLGKPLVSASALRTDGQLIVLNTPPGSRGCGGTSESENGSAGGPGGGPCYRCVFPRPPPPDAVVSCGEGGILGPVVGVMGVLQALEAVRLIAAGQQQHIRAPSPDGGGLHPPQHGQAGGEAAAPPSLLLFSVGAGGPSFRTVRMRGKRKECFACGPDSTLTLETLRSGSLDYAAFCGATSPVSVLKPEERVSVAAYRDLMGRQTQHVLLDVREKELFDIASIDGAVNVPFSKIQGSTRAGQNNKGGLNEEGRQPAWMPADIPADAPIYVVCRVGNDSQLVTRTLKDAGLDRCGERFIGDIRGGMRAWKREVDPAMPFA